MTPETSQEADFNLFIAAEFHELKNQLGALALTLDELAASRPEMTSALREPRHTCHLIGDRLVQILTLYKSDRGQLAPRVEARSPAELVSEVVATAVSMGTAKVAISQHLERAPPFWFFDRYLIGIALSNALHNALKFARSRIEVGTEARDGGIAFYVHDDSVGYTPEILQTQAQTPGTSCTGTGLGLYFARAIAEAHDDKGRRGSLRLENQDGALFIIWLP